MEDGKLVAICHCGGELARSVDGACCYSGGEARAIEISHETLFNNFKSEIAATFNVGSDLLIIKYILPSNRRTLITVFNDKDLRLMVDFHKGSMTADVYVSSKVNHRSMRCTCVGGANRNAADEHNCVIQRPTTTKNMKTRAFRGNGFVDDTSALGGVIGSFVDFARQKELNATELIANRVSFGLDSAADIATSPNLVTPIGDPDRTNTCNIADLNTPLAAPVYAGEYDVQPCSNSPWDNLITGVGQEFDNAKVFRDELRKYAHAKGFEYKYIKNDNFRVTVRCSAETCPWRIHASCSSHKQRLIIKKINSFHTCEMGKEQAVNGQVKKKFLADIIKDKLLENPQSKPKDIARDLLQDYGITLNYSQVWRLKEFAEKGLHAMREEVCTKLPWFCQRLVEANPDSYALIATSADLKVRRVFVSFHASVYGFEHGCRPLIFLDKVPLKANNQWKLMAAAAVDGNEEIFPMAFAAVDAETHDSWHWFLEQLKCAVKTSEKLTIVSSRGMHLDESVPKVFEDCFHGYSLFHLIEEFRKELKNGSWSDKVKNDLLGDLRSAAHAYVLDDFTSCIERIGAVSKGLVEWILSTKPAHWSNAGFQGSRYNHFSSNLVESLSSFLETKDESTIVQIFDALLVRLMETIDSRREVSNTWTSTLTPIMEKRLQEEMSEAQALNVICSSDTVFEVRGRTVNVVNIGSWECTCRKWQNTGLPCMHAIAVINRVGRSIYDYCSRYFRAESYLLTYSASIQPIADIRLINSYRGLNSYPPPTSRPPDRPKRKRINPYKTCVRPLHCSRCKEAGHNRATCDA